MIQTVQGLTPVAPVQAPAWPTPGLTQGATLDATVVGRLSSGEVRLALLGQLLDLMPAGDLTAGLRAGQTVRLTVLQGGTQPTLSLRPQDPVEAVPADVAVAVEERSAAGLMDADRQGAGIAGRTGRPPDLRVALTSMQPEPAELPAGEASPARPGAAALRAAVAAMLPGAAAVQSGLGTLLADAGVLMRNPEAVPTPVRAALQALATVGLDGAGLDATTLKQAVIRSGVFHESATLASSQQAADRVQTGRTQQAVPPAAMDLKSVLLTLRAAVAGWSAASQAEAPVLLLPDMAVDELGSEQAKEARPVTSGVQRQPSVAERTTPLPPPTRAITTAAQPAAHARIDAATSPADAARTVLSDVDGAIGRMRLLQASALPAAVLPDAVPAPAPAARPFDVALEIPLLLPGQTPVLSLAIGHDDEGRRGSGASSAAPVRAWKMQLSLDLDPAGPLHALVRLRGSRAGVTLWAERPDTLSAFQSSLPVLRDALHAADLDVESLEVLPGSPPQPRPVSAGSLLDRRS